MKKVVKKIIKKKAKEIRQLIKLFYVFKNVIILTLIKLKVSNKRQVIKSFG